MTEAITGACEHGVTIGRYDDMVYPLTPCHKASGKGSEVPTGVVCRACYAEVSTMYGDWAPLDQPDEAEAWFNESGCPTPAACAELAFQRVVEVTAA